MSETPCQFEWSARPAEDAIAFRLLDPSGSPLPPPRWGTATLRDRSGRVVNPAPLIGWFEDDKARLDDNGDLIVPHEAVARLQVGDLPLLRLPPPAPIRLHVRGHGIMTSPRFRLEYRLLKHNGQPVLGARREGVLLTIGREQYTLLDPLYTLVEQIEAFGSLPAEDMDGRMLAWTRMKEHLPEDALVDRTLASLTVVRPDALTLDLSPNGEFQPIPLARPHGRPEPTAEPALPPGERAELEAVLPESQQQAFVQRLERTEGDRSRYALQQGWYMVVDEPLRETLKVIREIQRAPLAERLGFVANPHAVLKERLAGRVPEKVIDQIFVETPQFVSDRISHLGEWEPKGMAYHLASGSNWFPEESELFAISVDNRLFLVAGEDLDDLQQRIRHAREGEQPEVEYRDQRIPATEETDQALERLGRALAMPEEAEEETAEGGKSPTRLLVPVIKDNIEEVEFVARTGVQRGEAGGLPEVLRSTLYPHQQEGLNWLQEHWVNGSPGALLADDMGLGKTLQTLAFLAWVREQKRQLGHEPEPILVVAPTGLLRNWEDEAATHLALPGLGDLFRAYGPDLRELRGLSLARRIDHFRHHGWVLTTYETLRDKIHLFVPMHWSVVVFDEAQKIKNPTVRITEMAKSVEGEFILALTGTPVENRLADLWSILDTVAAGELGSLNAFIRTYEPTAEDPRQEAIEQLRERLLRTPAPPRMLRRMKEDHLEGLPEKIEHTVRIPLTPGQVAAYDLALAPARAGALGREQILQVIQNLRGISLIPPEPSPEGLTDETIASSARLQALFDILDEVHEKREKALVFLEFLDLQSLLVPCIQRRYAMDEPPLRIHGSVPGPIRKRHVDTFQSRPEGRFDVMLLSPKAGGVGLNLTVANHVIHLSRWWNPAVEDQCTDRVFRIGQRKIVHVYCPIGIHPGLGEASFDVNLHNLLEKKRQLSRQLLSPPSASEDELEQLVRHSMTGD